MTNIFAHADAVYESTNISAAGEVSISWLAILLAVAAAMIIGTIWYGPLFGKKWMSLVGLKKKDMEKGSALPMIAMVVLALIQAFVISHFIAYTGEFYADYSRVAVGIMTSLWIFVGFIVPVLVGNTLFSKSSTELLKINLGNQLVTLLAMGAIIGAIS